MNIGLMEDVNENYLDSVVTNIKILVDKMPNKVTDCCLNSYETVFGKPVLVCKLSNYVSNC